MATESDPVNHPSHYKVGGYEVQDILDAFFPDDPDLWNAGKYLLRAGRKGNEAQDLAKAANRIERRIAKLGGK